MNKTDAAKLGKAVEIARKAGVDDKLIAAAELKLQPMRAEAEAKAKAEADELQPFTLTPARTPTLTRTRTRTRTLTLTPTLTLTLARRRPTSWLTRSGCVPSSRPRGVRPRRAATL